MQRSATDADPMNNAQLETELNMIQERRAAEMKDVAKMDARLAALAEEKAKIAARRAAAMGEVAKMDSRTAEIKGQRASRAATSRASASSASLRRKPTLNEVDRAADLAGDSLSPENELKKQYKLHKAQCAAQLAELALAPASPDSAANDAELNPYLHRVGALEHRGPPAPNRFEPAQTEASDKDMASLGMAMRERASPAKTRPPAAKPEPTSSKSQAADQKEPSFGAANASTAPTDRPMPIKEQENNQVSRTATSSPKVRGPPAPNVRYEPAQTKKALAFAKAEAELKLYLANSPIKDTHRKEFVDAEIARTAPASPLHQARRGPMVKVRSRPTSPRGKPRAASPNFRKAMETMNVVSRSVNPLVNPRASIAPGPAPAGGV